MITKAIYIIILAVLLSACGAQATHTPEQAARELYEYKSRHDAEMARLEAEESSYEAPECERESDFLGYLASAFVGSAITILFLWIVGTITEEGAKNENRQQ